MKLRARSLGWWHGLAPRERAMLAVMALMLAAFAWWYGLLLPLRALRDAAAERHDRAVATLREVEAVVSAPGGAAALAPPPSGAALPRLVLDSARAAGLSPSRPRSVPGGAFVLEFEGVDPPALFGWLGVLATDHGLAPSSLRVLRADGALRAEAGFGGAAQ